MQMDDIIRRLERQEAGREIQNILARYTALHAASMQEETCELYCKHTLGTYCIFNGDVYNGYEGVRNHFVGRMTNSEQDLTGRLYLHEMVTPLIEVAGDCQTAKCLISTIGCETGVDEDGGNLSLWSYARYRFDFAKEDGQWKIWHQQLYGIFLTPYASKGWTEIPWYDVYANPVKLGIFEGDPDRYISYRLSPEYHTKPFSITSPDCDIHNLIPKPPQPYWTWDEPIGPPEGEAIM